MELLSGNVPCAFREGNPRMMKPGPIIALLPGIITHLAQAAVVATQSGRVRGGSADAIGDVMVYRGIPYAAPPVGALRWREPQAPIGWTGIREASAATPGCIQTVAP